MFFDARLLARRLRAADLDDLRWFGVAGGLVPPAPAGPGAAAAGLRAGWEEQSGPVVKRLRRAGFHGVVALGLAPRGLPLRGLEALLHELPDYLARPGVAAIGEVGLEEGGAREERVLERQLELATALRRPVVAALPGRRREALARRLLAVLRASELEPSRVLVQGVDAGTVRMVRACGHLAGLLLGDSQAIDEAVRLVRSLGPEGLVLSSGAGEAGGDLLALPRAAARLRQAGLSAAVARRVCGGNALRLLGIDLAALRRRGRAGR